MTRATITYPEMREARQQILAVKDPEAQTALFTLLGLIYKLVGNLDEVRLEADRS